MAIKFGRPVEMRDTPRSVGLPEISTGEAAPEAGEDRSSADYQAFVRNQVFLNPFIWLVSLANFFVYILRFAVLDWGPTLLKEMKHFPLQQGGWMVGAFEVSGLAGMLLAGWVTDRVFGGRGARTCVFCMVGASVALLLFWRGADTPATATVLLAAGTKGKRHALPNCRVMIHQPLIMGSGISGQAADIDIAAKEILRMRERLNDILVDRTGQPLKRIQEDTDRDYIMSADQGKEYGIIDDVIRKRV